MEESERSHVQAQVTELMKTGSAADPKEGAREKSEEELLWQNELKDLLWLEVQAWLSDRSIHQQDQFLFTERQRIPAVLQVRLHFIFDQSSLFRVFFSYSQSPPVSVVASLEIVCWISV